MLYMIYMCYTKSKIDKKQRGFAEKEELKCDFLSEGILMTKKEFEEVSERVEQYKELSADLDSAEELMWLLDSLCEGDGTMVEIKVTRFKEDCIAKKLEPDVTVFTPANCCTDSGVWAEGLRQLLKKHIAFTKEYMKKL